MTCVLIVDDDDQLRSTTAELLEMEGYATAQARDGIEALTILEQTPDCEVILCDIRMPDMDGFALLGRLRAEHPDLAVIMLTGYGSIESAVEAMRQGAVNYLIKPVNQRQLLESIRDALEVRRAQLQNQVLMGQIIANLQSLGLHDTPVQTLLQRQVDSLQSPSNTRTRFLQARHLLIDQDRLIAFCKGRTLELTPTEFEILYCLVQAGERVVTYEEIAYHLQGIHLSRDEARRMLSSHLSNLRSKLEKAGCPDCLVNSRGRGYFIQTGDGMPPTLFEQDL